MDPARPVQRADPLRQLTERAAQPDQVRQLAVGVGIEGGGRRGARGRLARRRRAGEAQVVGGSPGAL